MGQPGPLPYADITDPQALNKYAYVRNNPLRYVDPDGHEGEETVIDVAIEEVDKVVRPLINSAYEGVASGGKMAARGFGMALSVPLLLLTTPAQLGGNDEVRFEAANRERMRQQQQNQGNAESKENPAEPQAARAAQEHEAAVVRPAERLTQIELRARPMPLET